MRGDTRDQSSSHGGALVPTANRRPRRLAIVLIGLVLLASALAIGYAIRSADRVTAADQRSAEPRRAGTTRPLPVAAAAARAVDLPVRLTALGTVTARNTVTVKTRVDGQLVRVAFEEGQTVKAGQLLAQVDPRPFEVALAQAQGQQGRDRAQLDSARVDLVRYQGLLRTDSIAKQQVDQQEGLVKQFEAAVAADQAAVDSARLQLSFTRIVAPVTGRVGLRQIDAGNQVHASDANGIAVVTEVEPIFVVFPVPQDPLPAVLARLQAGAELPVDAFDREGRTRLASGKLVSADNMIDPATGTARLKAEFDNHDGALFPNQFVNVRLQVDTVKNAIVVPTSSVLRGAPGTYVYVVKEDGTVSVRPVNPGPVDGDITAIAEGLTVGERVVTDGTDKLREGARVEVIDRAQAPGAGTPTQPRGPDDASRRRGGGKT